MATELTDSCFHSEVKHLSGLVDFGEAGEYNSDRTGNGVSDTVACFSEEGELL